MIRWYTVGIKLVENWGISFKILKTSLETVKRLATESTLPQSLKSTCDEGSSDGISGNDIEVTSGSRANRKT